jgi:metal-dependent amidase/aminoacylase/carboxypeptidase family protein
MTDEQVLTAVEATRATCLETLRFVHDHPELGHEEHECAAHLCATLAAAGLEVERGLAGLPTAFRATLRGARPGPAVGVVCLYDAVPAVRPDGSTEAVHSCGHGPIAGAVVGSALALASLRGELGGTLVVVGCPADEIHAPGTAERGGGKALTAEAGVWDSLDAALYAHPEFLDTVNLRSRWLRRDRLRVAGTRSLGGEVEAPLAAARALLETAAALGPDAMVERLVLDGDVEDGTGLVLLADLLLFADDEAGVAAHARALRGALPAGEWREGRLVVGVRPDERVTAVVAGAFRALGRPFVADPAPLPFATDFGNVSWRCPAALIGIGREGGWAFHSDEGARQFASADGEEAAQVTARILALAATRLLAS